MELCDEEKKPLKSHRKRKRSKLLKLEPGRFFAENDFVTNNETDLFEKSSLLMPSPKNSRSLKTSRMSLTPSKSEDAVNNLSTSNSPEEEIFSKFDNSAITTSDCDDVDSTSSTLYNSVIEEFLDEDLDDGDSAIISSTIKTPLRMVQHTKSKVISDIIEDNKFNVSRKKNRKIEMDKRDRTHEKIVDASETKSLEELAENHGLKAHYHYTSDGMVVILQENQQIHFHGLLTLSVLHGEIEVLGHILNRNSEDFKLYSLRGTSLLYLKNVTKSSIRIGEFLNNLNIPNKHVSLNCAVLLCKKLDDSNMFFIEKHMSQQILPKEDKTNLPRVVFEPKGTWNLIHTNPNWHELTEKITSKTKMLICGGKGVGKSTFLRYMINKLLMTFQEVKVVDLDPGQSEFTLPGCISISTVKKPIFGVNYTHLQKPDRSVISNINIAYEPQKYIESVNLLLRSSFEEVPIIYNYMGFTHGIGANILCATIVLIQPTDIVQINSSNDKKNYKSAIDPNFVINNANLFLKDNNMSCEINYNLYQMESMTDFIDGWTAQPRQLREMCILSHLSHMIQSNSIFNTSLPLYKVDLSDIVISDLNGEVIHPAAVNANLVALCSVTDTQNCIFENYGWGIVRGVDIEANALVLLTSEEIAVLEKTTHLVLSSISLPPSVYMTPDEVVGEMPYVIRGDLMSFGQIPKRSHLPAKS